MRYRIAVALVSITMVVLAFAPSSTLGQFGGKKGGFGGGGFGGPKDPFDYLSKGRGYFLVDESPRLRDMGLGQFLKDQGVRSGQVTRELFTAYNQQMRGQGFGGQGGFGGRPGGFPGQGGGFNQGPGGFQPFGGQQGGNPVDTLNQLAEADFNARDLNGDGFLNQHEMPDQLKSELNKWDTNRDGLISLDEYKAYYVANRMNRRGGGNQQINPVQIIIEDEVDLDARPTVLRAGKLPTKELPPWFMELDTNKDGQVSLAEWHKGKGDDALDEFREWDRNDDGFITPEEALYKQRQIQLASSGSKSENGGGPQAMASRKGPNFNGAGDNPFGGRNKGGGKKGGKGGFPPKGE
jgi:hypothetical protein